MLKYLYKYCIEMFNIYINMYYNNDITYYIYIYISFRSRIYY